MSSPTKYRKKCPHKNKEQLSEHVGSIDLQRHEGNKLILVLQSRSPCVAFK